MIGYALFNVVVIALGFLNVKVQDRAIATDQDMVVYGVTNAYSGSLEINLVRLGHHVAICGKWDDKAGVETEPEEGLGA